MLISTSSAASCYCCGLYYHLIAGAGASGLAKLQGWLHIVGAIVFPVSDW